MVAVWAILAWSSRFKFAPSPLRGTDHRALSSPPVFATMLTLSLLYLCSGAFLIRDLSIVMN